MTVQLGSDDWQLAIIIDYWWDYHLDLVVRYQVTVRSSESANCTPPFWYLLPVLKVFRLVVLSRLILNTRSVDCIPKIIKNPLGKFRFSGCRRRPFAANLSTESDEKWVHQMMVWVDGSKTSKRGLDRPTNHRFLVPGRDYREG